MFSVTSDASRDWNAARIVVESLSTGERRTLVEGGSDARYLPTGHIIYALGNDLFAIAFDLGSKSVSGGPIPLIQGVMRGLASGAANFSVADDGTLAYVTGYDAENSATLVWVDRSGAEKAIPVSEGSSGCAKTV